MIKQGLDYDNNVRLCRMNCLLHFPLTFVWSLPFFALKDTISESQSVRVRVCCCHNSDETSTNGRFSFHSFIYLLLLSVVG